jgi:hypothetical protein
MKVSGVSAMRRFRPLVAGLPHTGRPTCWYADGTEHELDGLRG